MRCAPGARAKRGTATLLQAAAAVYTKCAAIASVRCPAAPARSFRRGGMGRGFKLPAATSGRTAEHWLHEDRKGHPSIPDPQTEP